MKLGMPLAMMNRRTVTIRVLGENSRLQSQDEKKFSKLNFMCFRILLVAWRYVRI